MEKFYQTKVKVQSVDDKTRTELYLVKAVSVTDAEAKMTEHLAGEDFQVVSVTETKILEVIA